MLFSIWSPTHKLKVLTENLINDLLENLTLRIQKSTQQQGRSGSDEGWDGSGQICNIRKNCFSDKNFHRFVQTKWTLIRYSKMDREGWFPKFVIMRNIIKSDMRKVTILLWSLSQDFSKIREMTTISCLCQIYIQTILKFINNYACCPF